MDAANPMPITTEEIIEDILRRKWRNRVYNEKNEEKTDESSS